MRTVTVIGGGISGLAAAWALRDTARVVVLDTAPQVGGKLRTGRVAGVPVDLGAESMTAMRPEAVRLAEDVGLADALCTPRPAPVTVWSRGALRTMPPGHVMGIPTRLDELAASGLLSDHGMAQLRRAEELVPPTTSADVADVTVGEYLTPLLGEEAVERLIAPLLGGIHAGDVNRLSLASVMPQLAAIAQDGEPLLAALRRKLSTGGDAPRPSPVRGVAGGLGHFAQEVARASGATVLTGTTALALDSEPRGASGWRTHAATADGLLTLDSDAVVLALPAHGAAPLLRPHAPLAAEALAGIDHATSAVVTLAFSRDGTTPGPLTERNGFLVPPGEGAAVKGATFLSTKWSWQSDAAPDLFLLRASLGRAGNDTVSSLTDTQLLRVTVQDLTAAIGPLGSPLATEVTRWDRGLPQYHVGHSERVRRIRGGLAGHPGLAVCGAAYDGVGVSACVASGFTAARVVMVGH
ncbi:protoporphyrinogen oxidase [Streptomyces sp. NPDC058579]|uniref:protoporphyrinogen oxidase n=1 Tax=Streptomyces sp. NPDC058579 TaxID=3346548 RepID=UPI00364B7971